jgi:beta-mannosidase
MSLFRKKPADDASGFPSTFLRHAGSLCLDGTWLIKDETPGEGAKRRNFDDDREDHGWLPAAVPCSVQTVLLERNRIPDPYTGRSNLDCLWMEEREWWFKKRFVLPHDWGGSNVLLAFDGVDYWGEFWLNGHPLGFHEGMFGGPFFVVTDLLSPGQENNLTVKLDPAPRNWRHHLKNSVSYGWHYGRYVTAGIWQSVHLIRCAAVLIENVEAVPLKVRSDEALMEIGAEIWCFEKSLRGELSGEIRGKGFDRRHPLKERVRLHFGRNLFRFRTRLSDPRFWWPSSHGSPNLYACTMQVCAMRVRAVRLCSTADSD